MINSHDKNHSVFPINRHRPRPSRNLICIHTSIGRLLPHDRNGSSSSCRSNSNRSVDLLLMFATCLVWNSIPCSMCLRKINRKFMLLRVSTALCPSVCRTVCAWSCLFCPTTLTSPPSYVNNCQCIACLPWLMGEL